MSFDDPGSLPPLYVEIRSDQQHKLDNNQHPSMIGAQGDTIAQLPLTMPEIEWTSSLDVNAATRTIDTWSEDAGGTGGGNNIATTITTADSSSIGGGDNRNEPMDDDDEGIKGILKHLFHG
jgi:hypothetical protein